MFRQELARCKVSIRSELQVTGSSCYATSGILADMSTRDTTYVNVYSASIQTAGPAYLLSCEDGGQRHGMRHVSIRNDEAFKES